MTTELATIQQLDPMGVDVQVSSRVPRPGDRDWSARACPSRSSGPGLEGEPEQPHEGTVNFIDNMIDPTTSTFLSRADVANPQGMLLPGEYVKADDHDRRC